MSILLDANVILWWVGGDPRLGKKARALLESPDNYIIVSVLSLFELELKIKAGRLQVSVDLVNFLENSEVEIYSPLGREVKGLLSIETHHKDPFDRALVGLAALKSWRVMTSDQQLINLGNPGVKVIDSRL